MFTLFLVKTLNAWFKIPGYSTSVNDRLVLFAVSHSLLRSLNIAI